MGLGRGQFTVAEVHAEGLHGDRQMYGATDGVLHEHLERIRADDLVSNSACRRCAVQFLSPTRIRNDGNYRRDLTFQDLVRALLRRLSSLCYFHCGCELQVDFKRMIDQAAAVRTVRCDLRWQEQERFSGRQRQRIEMGGVVGRVEFEADDAEVMAGYWPLLKAGEWVHVGKGCVMGLGRYRVETV